MRTFFYLFLAIMGLSLAGCNNKKVVNPETKTKPNFLFILTDDQTYESINILNNSEIETPNMDKLVNKGVTFTHCFNQGSWSGAVCVASRTMLITGQTVFKAPQNAIYLDKWAQEKEDSNPTTEVPLWPEILAKNGYETFLTGKWHNSSYALLKGFDKASGLAKGFYDTRDKNGSTKPGYNRSSADSKWKPWDVEFTGHWTPKVNNIIYNEKGEKKISPFYALDQHTTELYADKAINYLMTDAQETQKPFFMFVAFNAPHDPRQSPKEFVDKYPVSSVNIPENYLNEHPFDQGDFKVRDERLAPFPRTKEAVQLHRAEYYAIITHFDKELGRILDALEKSGKAENTYVFLTSDHGLAVGQHGLMGKQNQYDHSIRIPLIVRIPGQTSGRKISKKVYLQSMFATTCDLASIEIPETVEFKSISNLINGSNEGGEDYIFGTYKKYQRMIRSDKYKLIIYPHIKKMQLFDLEFDPKEMKNLADNKQYKKIKKELFEQIRIKQLELEDNLKLNFSDYNL